MSMKKVILFILVILWMGVIFLFSSYNGNDSTNQSDIITRKVVEILHNTFDIEIDEDDTVTISFYVRKTAHITEYFILCLLVSLLLECYSLSLNKILLLSFIISYIYACSDEFHQLYINDRSGSFIDTLIDSIGMILWIIILKIKGVKSND